MKKQYLGGMAILGVTLLLAACGGGGGGGTSSTSDISGSWKGVYHDILGAQKAEMDVAVSGTSITDISFGGVSTGDSGAFTLVQSKIYEYSLAGGGYGGFLVDSSGTHAALLDEWNSGFAVLQKSASAIKTNFTLADVGGNWSGYSIYVDASSNLTVANSSVSVAGDGSFSGTGIAGPFTGAFTSYDVWGIYWGTYTNTGSGISGDVYAYLSPDGTFAASWACDYGDTPPSPNCTYNSWNK